MNLQIQKWRKARIEMRLCVCLMSSRQNKKCHRETDYCLISLVCLHCLWFIRLYVSLLLYNSPFIFLHILDHSGLLLDLFIDLLWCWCLNFTECYINKDSNDTQKMFKAFWTLLVSCIPELFCQAGIEPKGNLEFPEMAGWFERWRTCSKRLIQCWR